MFRKDDAKIYKIKSTMSPVDNECYIGSTCLTIITDRLERHKRDYSLWKLGLRKDTYTIFLLFDKYPLQTFIIELIEKCEVASKEELLSREKFYICSVACVNKNMKPPKVVAARKDDGYVCGCGVLISRQRDRARHELTKKHLLILQR